MTFGLKAVRQMARRVSPSWMGVRQTAGWVSPEECEFWQEAGWASFGLTVVRRMARRVSPTTEKTADTSSMGAGAGDRGGLSSTPSGSLGSGPQATMMTTEQEQVLDIK